MIDPINMTEYGAGEARLQEIILFCVAVSGKNALTTANRLEQLLDELRKGIPPRVNYSPFNLIRRFVAFNSEKKLAQLIRKCGLGCYNHRAKSFIQLAKSNLNLKTCTIADLEKIYGIGAKTSRFFILHTREGANGIAVLDTHILSFMRDRGISTPKTTPSGKKYLVLEAEFVKMARESNLTVAQYDLAIWREYSGNKVKK